MKKRFYILLVKIQLSIILLATGCITSRSLVYTLLPDNDWPKKRIMVTHAIDLTGIGLKNITDRASEELADILKKMGSFNVLSNSGKKPFFFTPGEPIDPEIMREASETGMHAIVFETINPVEKVPAKSGFWPFRTKTQKYIVSMNIDLVDVNKGTKLLSEEVTEDIILPDEEVEVEPEASLDLDKEAKKEVLEECLPNILEKAAIIISDALNREIWTGKIVSADNMGITINAGQDVGLRPGIVFEVFDQGECITSCNGQNYYLPGPKVGEIKIVEIRSQNAYAKPIQGTAFKPGQMIRLMD
ncbi:MAG TPA: hypothetical protein VMW42_03495 [Desulfatiglandales bacterium]|nr:hypothetical protein [Desulfatiglandales bacterium]